MPVWVRDVSDVIRVCVIHRRWWFICHQMQISKSLTNLWRKRINYYAFFRPHRPFCSNLPSSRRLVSCPRRRRRLSLMASVVTARSFLLFLCVCWHVFSSARQRTVDVWEFYASCVWSTDRQRRPLVLNAQLTSARIGSSEREMKGNPREKKKFTDRERDRETESKSRDPKGTRHLTSIETRGWKRVTSNRTTTPLGGCGRRRN